MWHLITGSCNYLKHFNVSACWFEDNEALRFAVGNVWGLFQIWKHKRTKDICVKRTSLPVWGQVHGDHPPPAAEADVHGDPGGDGCDLDAGSASRLPPVLLLDHHAAAWTHRLLHRLAWVHHHGLQEDVSDGITVWRALFWPQSVTNSLSLSVRTSWQHRHILP